MPRAQAAAAAPSPLLPLILLAAAAACCSAAENSGGAPPSSSSSDKPTPRRNPFVNDANRTVVIHHVSADDAKSFIKSKKKYYHVVALINLPKDRHAKECPRQCAWLDKQFEALAEGYVNQLNAGDAYEQGGTPLFFARIEADARDAPIVKTFDTRVPALFLMRAKESRPTRFGTTQLTLPRIPDAFGDRVRAKREAVAKERRSVRRAVNRQERRRRQVTTQEDREEATTGVRDYQTPNMRNLCKWLRVHTGHGMKWCPQDVAHDAVKKKSHSEVGKQALVVVGSLCALMMLMRIFSVGFAVFDPSIEDLQRNRVIARGVREHQDQHVAYQYVDPYWRTWTTLAFFAVCVFASCCVSGMYHNFLQGRAILGDPLQAPLQKVTGYKKDLPQFSAAVAFVVAVSALSLIAMGRAATSNHILVKLPVVFCATFVWVCTGFFMLSVFVDRNRSYLHNTALAPFLEDVVKKLR